MIKIKIYLDGKEVAMRSWPAVPRNGDDIKLHGPLSGVYQVGDICWSGDEELCVLMDIHQMPAA